ncbi:MAG: dihydrodipicolinate synthase family protein [Calditrichaceae bacterium]|nr:dihydrodipicolinate synthase family protein [Calditrichaceae bacterium]MBN2707790.1 dihydrodipicolinate synthase family protein [Calditrichaceae bacterium]RQV96284.1 MAG: dihydrodipicolinate synthase family protein [Calditrichota bacterium]
MKPIPDGIYAASITPLDENLNIDFSRLIRHSFWLLENGCSGVLLMGTTSEANSFTVNERKAAIEAVVKSGFPVNKLLVGTGCPSYKDTIDLTGHALSMGLSQILMLPPFYYKPVSDDGLFSVYEKIIGEVSGQFKIYLYHFPALSGIFLSDDLISRLSAAFPDYIAGIKDSGGDWEHMRRLCGKQPGFKVFSGNEKFLKDILDAGGAGCITAVTNISGYIVSRLFLQSSFKEAENLQVRINSLREIVEKYPVIPAVKELVGFIRRDESWNRVRPPLVRLSKKQILNLHSEVKSINFPNDFIKKLDDDQKLSF